MTEVFLLLGGGGRATTAATFTPVREKGAAQGAAKAWRVQAFSSTGWGLVTDRYKRWRQPVAGRWRHVAQRLFSHKS